MKKILTIGLVALLAACSSSDKPHDIQWGAARPSTTAEQAALDGSLVTLEGSLSYDQVSDPQSGMAGFGEELLEALSSAAAPPSVVSTKLAQGVARGAMTGICGDPSVQGDVTTYVWSGCEIADSSTGTPMTVTMDGSLTWNPALGETRWQIGGTESMTLPMGDATYQIDGTFQLTGGQTVTATTIVANTSSVSHAHAVYQGPEGTFAEDSDATTTLDADLQYSSDPYADPTFCLTGGTLKVVQQQRPAVPALRGFELTFGPGCNDFLIKSAF